MTVQDAADSLTGFDELAIVKLFGRTVTEISSDHTMFLRALAFIIERRNGKSDTESYKAVMTMSMHDAMAYFEDTTPGEAE